MPRFEAPNHPDCFIDCPGGGFAHYTEQYGPCTKGCDPNGLVEAHARLVRSSGWDARSSGMVEGMSARALMKLVNVLVPLATNVARAETALKDLRESAEQLGDERVSVDWDDTDAVEVLEKLTVTTGRVSFA